MLVVKCDLTDKIRQSKFVYKVAVTTKTYGNETLEIAHFPNIQTVIAVKVDSQ